MAADRDRALFRAIYDEYATAILNYAVRRTFFREDAADVVAETFLIAWRKLDQVPPGVEAKYWLYAVARRVLANHSRKSSNYKQLGSELKENLRLQQTTYFEDASVINLVVSEALQQLDEQELELIRLSVWEGFNSKEIGMIFGISSVTVRTKLHKIRGRLKTYLKENSEISEQLQDGTTYT